MTAKDFFTTGIKLLGVYLLATGLIGLPTILGWFGTLGQDIERNPPIQLFNIGVQIVLPVVIQLSLGIYFLTRGSLLSRLAGFSR